MKPDSHHYVYYPGHLGRNPVTELTGDRGILWDAPVKRVPAAYVASLVNESGFQLALDLDEAAKVLKRSKKKLDELVHAGDLVAAVYKPPLEGEDEVQVIVLPAGCTVAALKARLDADAAGDVAPAADSVNDDRKENSDV